MPDPLLPLLATIERLDREASAGPWKDTTNRIGDDSPEEIGIVSDAGPVVGMGWYDGPHLVLRPRDAALIVFSRNTLAPLASMLRVAVEALDGIDCWYEDAPPRSRQEALARAALATIRRMAEEVERGQR